MSRRFQKRVQVENVDEERRVATGAAMVPDRVDLQGDFERPEAIREAAEDYMHRRSKGPDAQYPVQDGVMHAAFPDDAASVVESTVLDEDREVGGIEYPAGTWIISRRYDDDELWSLVRDGVLGGFSIGGQILDDAEHETVPDDVTVPDDYPDDRGAVELIQLRINEISDVDIPAVPDATYATVKSLEKSVLDDVTDLDEFIELMAGRGHDEDDALRMWDYLWQAKARELGVDEEKNFDGCVASLMDDGHSEEAARNICGAQYQEHKDMDDTTILRRFTRALQSITNTTEKDGRTLSEASLTDAKAIHDASEALIARELNHETNRFTDDPDDSFDIAAYGDGGAKTASMPEKAAETDDTMTDEDTESDLAETVEALNDRIESLEKDLADADDGGDEETEKNSEESDLADAVESLTEKVESIDERVETIGKQSGESTQIGGSDDEEPAEKGIDSADMMRKLGLPAGGD